MDIRQNRGAYIFIVCHHEVSGRILYSKSEIHHMDLQNLVVFPAVNRDDS